VSGVKHRYLPSGGDCQGAENCAVSTTPIQDALNAVVGGLAPDDGAIYIEGGQFSEFVQLDNFTGSLTLQGSVNGSATVLAGGVGLSNLSGSIQLRDLVFDAGVSVIGSSGLTIAGSVFNAGLLVLNSQGIQLQDNQHNAGVIVSGSQGVAMTNMQTNAGLLVAGSDVTVVGTEEDDRVEAELEGDANALTVSGGGGSDTLALKLNASRTTLVDQKVAAGASVVQYDESVENLSVEATSGDVEIIEDVALLGDLDILAQQIQISSDVLAAGIRLAATGAIEQEVGTRVSGQHVAYTAGTMYIGGEVCSEGDIALRAADGIVIVEGASLSAVGDLFVVADSNGDGVGIFAILHGARLGAQQGSIALTAADVVIEGQINAQAGGVVLSPSSPDTPIVLGMTGSGFNLSAQELGQILSGGSITIGSATHTGPIQIGQLDLQTAGFDLKILGGEIGLGEIALAFGMVLQLVALGGIFDLNGKGRNITIPGHRSRRHRRVRHRHRVGRLRGGEEDESGLIHFG